MTSTTAATCPECRKPAARAYAPFCSKRCADLDLGRWLKGAYVVPGRDGEASIETMIPDADDDGAKG